MAYQEVIAPATAQGVIDAIRSFAAANGWTVSRNNLAGDLRTLTLKRAETDYIHIYNAVNTRIDLRGTIDYNAATTPQATTRGSTYARANLNESAGPYTKLFLFGDSVPSPHIHAVIETNVGGIYRSLSFGCIEKIEAFTGGTYTAGVSWYTDGINPAPGYNSQNHALFGSDTDYLSNSGFADSVRVDYAADNRVDAWHPFSGQAGDNDVFVRSNISYQAEGVRALVELCDENRFSNRSILHPIDVRVQRAGGYTSHIGRIPNLRFCSLLKFNPAAEVTIGSEVWKIFPISRKFSTALNTVFPAYQQHSNLLGYAFKKVV